jgi:hypothetical protein
MTAAQGCLFTAPAGFFAKTVNYIVAFPRFDAKVVAGFDSHAAAPGVRLGHMFLRLGDDRALIDERTSTDAAGAIIDRDRGVDKIAVGIRVADA